MSNLGYRMSQKGRRLSRDLVRHTIHTRRWDGPILRVIWSKYWGPPWTSLSALPLPDCQMVMSYMIQAGHLNCLLAQTMSLELMHAMSCILGYQYMYICVDTEALYPRGVIPPCMLRAPPKEQLHQSCSWRSRHPYKQHTGSPYCPHIYMSRALCITMVVHQQVITGLSLKVKQTLLKF